MKMKWRIYLAATLLTALAMYYQSVAKTGFSTEVVVGWIVGTLAGGALWGFVGNWAYSKWRKKTPN